MKPYKKITIITLILIVATIISICFGGIYKLQEYKVINIVPRYLLGMEFNKKISLNLTVDDTVISKTVYDSEGNVINQVEGVTYSEEDGFVIVEDKVNKDDKLNTANYELSKNILKKRLKLLKAEQYNVRQDNTGNITIELPDNDKSTDVLATLTQTGKFEIVDDETSEVLMNNTTIKNTLVVYSTEESKTTVYLQVNLTEEGAKKLEEISNIYIETKTEATEIEEATTTTKKISIKIDDTSIMTTYFGETMTGRNVKYTNGFIF